MCPVFLFLFSDTVTVSDSVSAVDISRRAIDIDYTLFPKRAFQDTAAWTTQHFCTTSTQSTPEGVAAVDIDYTLFPQRAFQDTAAGTLFVIDVLAVVCRRRPCA